jgi:hypothetical protein
MGGQHVEKLDSSLARNIQDDPNGFGSNKLLQDILDSLRGSSGARLEGAAGPHLRLVLDDPEAEE